MKPFLSWAWTPDYLRRQEQQEREQQDMLILPSSAFNPQDDAAFAHFSGFRDGEQYSWLWLFSDDPEGKREAVSVRTIAPFLPDDDPIGGLIEATLPRQPSGPVWCYLQKLPIEWVQKGIISLDEVQEVWIGFNWQSYFASRDVDRAVKRYSSEEFRELCSRITR